MRRAAWVTAIAVGAIGALGALAWTGLSVLVARTVVTPVRRYPDDVAILAIDETTVTLSADAETSVPGRYGFWFTQRTGYARLGDVVRRGAGSVTRQIEEVVHGDLRAASAGRWTGWYYLTPADLGFPHHDVEIPTELGPQAAWHIPPEPHAEGAPTASGDWAVLVHGRGVTRSECLRAVPTLRAAGLHCLVVSYRNDPDAPASLDGRYSLGQQEWQDVEAALHWATEQGAERFVLCGWSMGGATVLQTLHLSALRDRIRGLVLDSAVVDWRAVLEEQGRLLRVPGGVRETAIVMLGGRWSVPVAGLAEPLDLRRLDWVRRSDELDRPMLILHSRADRVVPIAPSARLAELRPELVTLVPFEEAQHTRLWNYDPARWTDAVRIWLSELP
ncbi:MAG: alpha/beta fold hydrolase [Micrococcales bacterium]|nr:alpha/beta fold hydrolase [Micrococcales bacterium]